MKYPYLPLHTTHSRCLRAFLAGAFLTSMAMCPAHGRDAGVGLDKVPTSDTKPLERKPGLQSNEGEGNAQRALDEPLSFLYYQRCIFLSVRVNDQTDLLFLLDTGANISALDLKAAERVGIAVSGNSKVEGTTGVSEVKQALIRKLT